MKKTHDYDWDLFIVGAGAAGISASRAAKQLGLKTAIANYVKPTIQSTNWGFGGRCINTGSCSKKMMDYAAHLKRIQQDQKLTGWTVPANREINWSKMIDSIQDMSKEKSWSLKHELVISKIKAFKHLITKIEGHTLYGTDSKNQQVKTTAKYILIAIGTRSVYQDWPGARDCCLTPEDFFWRRTAPGKTLIIGKGMECLEYAGLISGLGFDTTVLTNRPSFYEQIDPKFGKKIQENVRDMSGVKIITVANPLTFSKEPRKGIKVRYMLENGKKVEESFSTVLLCSDRQADLVSLDLSKTGVKTHNGKILADEKFRTDCPWISASGSCIFHKKKNKSY